MIENNGDTPCEKESNDRFKRWQVVTLEQLTYSINLILTFAVATLGFQVSLLSNEKFIPVSFQKCSFALSMLMIFTSVFFGIYCTINRLRDFRATKEVARQDERRTHDGDTQYQRDLAKRLGERTWIIFWWQIATFGTGVLLLLIGISGIFVEKLF